jgi:NADPH:quinone reductase-like Zn-dependent oxidoreductase
MASEQNGTLPASQKKWILSGTNRGMDEWKLSEGPIPQVTSRGVLVRMVAAALNYREILIPDVSDEAAVWCSGNY